MSNIEINRKNIADMLLGLYEKEPFSMNTNVEKDSISEEFFQVNSLPGKPRFSKKPNNSIPWNGFGIKKMRRLSKFSANICHFSKCLSFSHPYENSTRLSLQMYHS